MDYEIAIIEPNVLTSLGLKKVLADIIPMATIRSFSSFIDFMDDTPYVYAHYFVSSRIYFEHPQFFREQQKKSILLIESDDIPALSGMTMLNICQEEKTLVKDILNLRERGHRGEVTVRTRKGENSIGLSVREIEVCILLAKGFTNKEIADQLNISLTTVISHRKNIMDKLSGTSLADIIIYAVMNGLVDISEI